jgi:hypothetical protein
MFRAGFLLLGAATCDGRTATVTHPASKGHDQGITEHELKFIHRIAPLMAMPLIIETEQYTASEFLPGSSEQAESIQASIW